MDNKIEIEINGSERLSCARKLTIPTRSVKAIEFDCYKSDCGICVFSVVEGRHAQRKKVEKDF